MQKYGFMKRKASDKLTLNFDECVTLFVAAKRLQKRSDRTINTYQQTYQAFSRWLTDKEYDYVDGNIAKEYIEYISFEKHRWDNHPTSPTGEKGLSSRAVNNIVRNLKVLFNFLVQERIITASPFETVRYQTEPRDTFEVFTDEDVLKLLDVPNRRTYTGNRDYVMMLVLMDTGLRIRELTSLKVKDIDFKIQQIVVRAENTKTYSMRVIPISDKCTKELRNLLEYMTLDDEEEYVWLTQFGERYMADTFSKMLKNYGKKAVVLNARVSPHTFRHYFAVKYLKSGGDTFSLMRILGHSDMSMTQRYVKYTNMDVHDRHNTASPVMNLLDKGNERKRGKVLFK
ncbi:tyrosine-type recombinase/integrase [Fictibacillus nanhaiensis]|uniref:tyrosine-type recombinase/integrase n=1 Tax=Fictibacillus nanhaiensis TaxID=742169 RepID=UPI003C207D48